MHCHNSSWHFSLATSDCRESLWAIWGCLLMTLAWLEVAAMLLMWFTGTQWTVAAHKERQRTRRLVDIHINAKPGLCSAAMSPSWGPTRAAWSLRTRSFIFIPPHQLRPKNCHETSQKMSGDVIRMPSDVPRILSDVLGQSLEVQTKVYFFLKAPLRIKGEVLRTIKIKGTNATVLDSAIFLIISHLYSSVWIIFYIYLERERERKREKARERDV